MYCETLKQARIKTINKVLCEGLISGRSLKEEGSSYLGSSDDVPTGRVTGIYLGEFPERDRGYLDFQIKHGLYMGSMAVLPVLSERSGEKFQDGGIDWAGKLIEIGLNTNILSSRMKASFLIVCDHTIPWNTPHVMPTLFTDILFPKLIWDECGSCLNIEGLSLRFCVIRGTIKRDISRGRIFEDVEVPDYEEFIKNMIITEQRKVWIHGVRLPTIE